MRSRKISKNWQRYLSLIGIALFIFILSKVDFDKFVLIMRQVRYPILFLLPFSVFFILLVQTLKWQKLLKIQGLNYSFWYLFKIHIIGVYYALITPSRIGFFVVAGYLNDSFGAVSASIIIDRILDTLTLIIFSFIGAFLLINRFPNLIFQVLFFAFCFIIAVLFFYSKKRAKFLFGFFTKVNFLKFHKSLKKIFHDFYDNLPRRRRLLPPFLLTVFAWFLIYSQNYMIAKALNINVRFYYFIFFFPIATIIGSIPITISGLGTREAILILLFSQFNIPVESIIALSLCSLILVSYIPALYGAFLSFKFKKDEK